MDSIFDNEIVVILAILFITLYAVKIGKVRLPKYVKDLFKNPIFQIIFLSLLFAYKFEKAPYVAIIIGIIFVLTLDYISTDEMKENFVYLEAFKNNLSPSPNIIDSDLQIE